MNNINKIEQERLNKLKDLLVNIGLTFDNDNDLFAAMCTDSRCYELKIPRTSATAIIGDKFLDAAIFEHCQKNIEYTYDKFTKEILNSFRSMSENSRLSKIMKETGISEYINCGNSELIVDKHLQTCFEALIYVIYKSNGIQGIIKFLERISFFK